MNGSPCGILVNDRDCPNATVPDIGLNLCRAHLEEAACTYTALAFAGAPPMVRLSEPCPDCNRLSLIGDITAQIRHCWMCGHEERGGVVYVESQPAPNREVPRASVVYYLRLGNRVKIGTTQNLRKRLLSLPPGELLGTERGGYEIEHQRHFQFRHLKDRGEWFRAEPELLAHAEAVRKATRSRA